MQDSPSPRAMGSIHRTDAGSQSPPQKGVICHLDEFKHLPPPLNSRRSPCPALNTLANHGFISRTGQNLHFMEVVDAIHHVYNLSYPLCLLLTLGGFITCGKLRFMVPTFTGHHCRTTGQTYAGNIFSWVIWVVHFLTILLPCSWSLDLDWLSQRGRFKIAHNASFVHPNNIPSIAPDHELVANMLSFPSTTHDPKCQHTGFQLDDVARYHALRLEESNPRPNLVHEEIALGECALAFLVLRGSHGSASGTKSPGLTSGTVSLEYLEQWFGEERLPDGWWDEGSSGLRPRQAIGLWEAQALALMIWWLAKSDGNVLGPGAREKA